MEPTPLKFNGWNLKSEVPGSLEIPFGNHHFQVPCEISGEYWTAYYLIVVLGWLKHHTYSVMAKWGR